MVDQGKSPLECGVLIALSRDDAKRLFGAGRDEQLKAFINEFLEDQRIWAEQRAVGCQSLYSMLQQCLNSGSADGPLEQCFLGGRPLSQGSEMTVCLVRPDMVPHIADALAGLSEEEIDAKLRSATVDEAITEAREVLAAVARFYQTAAANRHAVVFCAQGL